MSIVLFASLRMGQPCSHAEPSEAFTFLIGFGGILLPALTRQGGRRKITWLFYPSDGSLLVLGSAGPMGTAGWEVVSPKPSPALLQRKYNFTLAKILAASGDLG